MNPTPILLTSYCTAFAAGIKTGDVLEVSGMGRVVVTAIPFDTVFTVVPYVWRWTWRNLLDRAWWRLVFWPMVESWNPCNVPCS